MREMRRKWVRRVAAGMPAAVIAISGLTGATAYATPWDYSLGGDVTQLSFDP
jgi:hypothetical protein